MEFIPLSACDICSHLDEVEYSFSKHGWDDMGYSLPEQAGRLIPAENVEGYTRRNHHVKRCPICGIYYQYDYTYDYLVNGSEDFETLRRLTPDETRLYIPDDCYSFLIDQLVHKLSDPDEKTRVYAARSLMAHCLAIGDLAEASHYLKHPDEIVATGALLQLKFWTEDQASLEELIPLIPILRSASCRPDEKVSSPARYLLKYVFKTDVA